MESLYMENLYIYSIWRTCCKISSLTHNIFLRLEPALQIVYMYVRFNEKACRFVAVQPRKSPAAAAVSN